MHKIGSFFQEQGRKRLIIVVITGLATLAAVYAMPYVPFDNDISVMLPRQKEIVRAFRFFREAPFTANVIVSFELKEGSGTLRDLTEAVDDFSGKIDSPLISHVIAGADSKQSFEDMREFVRLSPQLMNENELKALDSKLNAEFVRGKLKKLYRTSLNPAGSFMLPMAQQDPLGFHEKALQDLRALLEGSDYKVRLENGRFVSHDGRHAMVILETRVPVTDGPAAHNLTEYLQGLLKNLPKNISGDLICGHLHSVSNEKTIIRDIAITTSVALIVFLFLFFFLFKDFRALLLFVPPLISVLISIPLCALIIGKLSYIIMGMGAVISGISVDYCIHVYIAMQSGQTRKDAVREIAQPVISGALTTAGAFAVFLFSGAPGYKQLALFTVVSAFLSLGLALLIFPYFLDQSVKGVGYRQKDFLKRVPAAYDGVIFAVWSLLLVVCAAAVPFVHFRMDVKQYDGSEKEIFQAEEKFHKVWGGNSKQAMLVLEAETLDKALETSDWIEPEALSVLGNHPYSRLSGIWPAETVRNKNLKRWNEYWNEERTEQLRQLIQIEGAVYDFSEKAFEPFLKTLSLDTAAVRAFENIHLLQYVKRRFAFETKDGYRLVSYFPDEKELADAMDRKSAQWPGAFVISAQNFEAQLSRATLTEAVWLSLAIAVILPVLAFMFLGNIRLVLISLLPVASSILCALGMLVIFKLNLNVASLIALMVVGGFSIDYGTFMIHQNEHDLKTNTYLGVTVSALTAFCGAGALLFAKHPVLFAYGTTMVCGVLAGYIPAVFVVPAIYRLAKQKKISQDLCKAV